MLELLQRLRALVQDALTDLRMEECEGAALGRPKVFLGAVPREHDEASAFPCVVIRWVGGEDDEEARSEEVEILCGVYSGGGLELAEEWAAVMLERLRGKLYRAPVQGRFELELPVLSDKPAPERQQENFHVARIVSRWKGFRPSQPRGQLSEGGGENGKD